MRLAGHQKNRFDLWPQAAIHQCHLQLVLIIRDGPNAADDDGGAALRRKIDQQSIERGDLDVGDVFDHLLHHGDALVDAEQRLFLFVAEDRDQQAIHQPYSALDEVEMAVRQGIERARINRKGGVCHSDQSTKIGEMETLAVPQVRNFNRTVTEAIGALDDRFLGRPRPLGEARMLWEIGPEGAAVQSLGRRLGLDSEYVSRALRSLEQQGLVVVRTNAEDRSVLWASLTSAGLAERAELDRRSDALALQILEPLSERQRATLVAAMTEVGRLVQASMVRIAIEDPATLDARWCFEQYFAELNERFATGFNPALSIPADVQELTPPAGVLLIARLGDRPVGCGALKFHGDQPAELKRMWIAPAARGLGLGRRLLGELERCAHEAGATVIRLETNQALREAIALYRCSGYSEVEAFNRELYAHHWFEKHI